MEKSTYKHCYASGKATMLIDNKIINYSFKEYATLNEVILRKTR